MPVQQPFCGGRFSPPRSLWIYSTVVLLLYGVFKEFKPSEAFLVPFLESPTDGKGINSTQVNGEIFPVWPYSYLGASLFVFLFTDLMRYNPVILIEVVAYLSTRILLIWGTSLLSQQLMQFAFGIASATEVGYYSYIYSAVPLQYYEKVTGLVRAAVLFGRSCSSFAGQIFYSTGLLDLYGLNYVSFASVCLSAVFAILLPWYFHWPCKPSSNQQLFVNFQEQIDNDDTNDGSCLIWIYTTWKNQFRDFVRFYTNVSLLKWSIWWALGMCGMLQIGNYVQSLWKEINEDNNDEDAIAKRRQWNGVVEGVTDLCAAMAALLASNIRINWSIWGELSMGTLSLLAAIVLMVSSYTELVWLAYCCHILYRSSYAFVITIASSQIAIHVDFESYGLIFGFNTFMALLLQTILTGIVNTWLNIITRKQFIIYGFYYYALTLVFVFAGVYKITKIGWLISFKQCCKRNVRRFDTLRESVVNYVSDNTSSESSDDDEADSTQPKTTLPNLV